MKQLEFKKTTINDKKILTEALEFYINDIHHIKMQEIEKMLECIAQRLYYRWLGLINKPSPAKKSTLKFPYDEGFVLKNAIYRYQENGNPNDLEHAILERYKFDLIQQLI